MLTLFIFAAGIGTIATGVGAVAAKFGKIDIDGEKTVGNYDVRFTMNEETPLKIKIEKSE